MIKLNKKLMAAIAVTGALLAGCGGGGGDAGTANGPQTIASVVDFLKSLFASNGENTDPIDINSLTLATDDTAEPAPIE